MNNSPDFQVLRKFILKGRSAWSLKGASSKSQLRFSSCGGVLLFLEHLSKQALRPFQKRKPATLALGIMPPCSRHDPWRGRFNSLPCHSPVGEDLFVFAASRQASLAAAAKTKSLLRRWQGRLLAEKEGLEPSTFYLLDILCFIDTTRVLFNT